MKREFCVTCNYYKKRYICPSCKVAYCWGCWKKHIEAEKCAYGKTKVLTP